MSVIQIFSEKNQSFRSVYVKKDELYFQDTNEPVLDDISAILKQKILGKSYQEIKYNGKLCAEITNTPYSFWRNANENIQEEVKAAFQTIAYDLNTIREKSLSSMAIERSKKANMSKLKLKVDFVEMSEDSYDFIGFLKENEIEISDLLTKDVASKRNSTLDIGTFIVNGSLNIFYGLLSNYIAHLISKGVEKIKIKGNLQLPKNSLVKIGSVEIKSQVIQEYEGGTKELLDLVKTIKK